VILSSHLLEEVERVCDSVLILSGGTVVTSGGLDELRGGGGAFVIEPVDRVDELAARLQRVARITVEVTGTKIVAEGDEIVVADAVRDACIELGIGLRRLQRRTATLEDVFLAAGTVV
jgi:ABC-2 type transport system ATP-binding protein